MHLEVRRALPLRGLDNLNLDRRAVVRQWDHLVPGSGGSRSGAAHLRGFIDGFIPHFAVRESLHDENENRTFITCIP